MAKSKNQIARQKYGDDFEDLSPGEKAQVSKLYKAQGTTTRTPVSRTSSAGIKCEIGRIGVNGVKPCLLNKGDTVADLIEQAGYEFDEKKESISAHSTGNSVALTDKVVDGETYVINPEIKSA